MGGWKVIGERGTMGWTEGSHDGRGEGGRGVEKGIMVSVGEWGEE